MARASYWELHWEREAAVVEAARRLARDRNSLDEVSRIISSLESSEAWVRFLLVKLSIDKSRVKKLMADIEGGLKPREELVEKVLRSLKARSNG